MNIFIHCYDCGKNYKLTEMDEDFIREHQGHKISFELEKEQEEMKPCPWCGEKEYLRIEIEKNNLYSIMCENCDILFGAELKAFDDSTYIIIGIFNSHNDAIEAWNDRSK